MAFKYRGVKENVKIHKGLRDIKLRLLTFQVKDNMSLKKYTVLSPMKEKHMSILSVRKGIF